MNLKEKYSHLTKANIEWIVNEAYPLSKLRITEQHLNKLLRAKSLILNHPMENISCWSCSARSYFKVCESVLDQHYSNLMQLLSELETQVAEGGEEPLTVENNTQETNEDVTFTNKVARKKKTSTVKESWEGESDEQA